MSSCRCCGVDHSGSVQRLVGRHACARQAAWQSIGVCLALISDEAILQGFDHTSLSNIFRSVIRLPMKCIHKRAQRALYVVHPPAPFLGGKSGLLPGLAQEPLESSYAGQQNSKRRQLEASYSLLEQFS